MAHRVQAVRNIVPLFLEVVVSLVLDVFAHAIEFLVTPFQALNLPADVGENVGFRGAHQGDGIARNGGVYSHDSRLSVDARVPSPSGRPARRTAPRHAETAAGSSASSMLASISGGSPSK